MTKKNPYEVLQLDPSASEAMIVQQAGRLRQRATDEQTLTEIRQAVQALTADEDARLLHSMLTHPKPEYHSKVLERLAAAFRRRPASSGESTFQPVFDVEAFRRQLLALVAGGLEQVPQPFESLPFEESDEEIHQQMNEMLFQSLIHHPRA